MSDIAIQALRYRVATYYDQSTPPGLLVPPEPPDPPILDAIDPTSIVAGGTGELVIVSGQNFVASSKVWADEEQQATTFTSAVTLTYMGQADQPGTQTITVRTGAMASNAIELTVTPPAVRAAEAGEADSQLPPPEDDPPTSRRRRT